MSVVSRPTLRIISVVPAVQPVTVSAAWETIVRVLDVPDEVELSVCAVLKVGLSSSAPDPIQTVAIVNLVA